jgi:transposase
MLQLTPQSRLFVATEPVDFRNGIDGLAAVCRRALGDHPLSGALSVFRNRAGTPLQILCSDGQGSWLCPKRLSQGRFTWWPTTQDASVRLSARALAIVRWNGHPQQAGMADDWRQLAEGGARVVGSFHGSQAAGAPKTSARGSCNATRYANAFTPAWRQVAMRLVSRLAMEALSSVAYKRLFCRWRMANLNARLQSMEGSLPPPLLQNRAGHFCGTRLLSDAPSVIGIRPTVSQTCDLMFRASPSWDIAPSHYRAGLALLQRYSSRSRAHHRPHVSLSEALPSALAS